MRPSGAESEIHVAGGRPVMWGVIRLTGQNAMANERYAFVRRSELTSTVSLQAAIDNDPNFALTIDPDTNLSPGVC